MEVLVAIADCVLAFMAIIAGVVSWFEYRSHKEKENKTLEYLRFLMIMQGLILTLFIMENV